MVDLVSKRLWNLVVNAFVCNCYLILCWQVVSFSLNCATHYIIFSCKEYTQLEIDIDAHSCYFSSRNCAANSKVFEKSFRSKIRALWKTKVDSSLVKLKNTNTLAKQWLGCSVDCVNKSGTLQAFHHRFLSTVFLKAFFNCS